MGKHTKTKEEKENKKSKTKKTKKYKATKKTWRIVLIVILLIIIGIGIVFAKRVHDLDGNWLAALMGHNKETLKNLDKLEILVLGESTGLSDTIIVCSYDPKTQQASMLSIPRDTFTGEDPNNARASQKINCLYSGGETPEKTLEAVNEITGLNLKYYILVDTQALKKLVDVIGGVQFNVPINMKYDDYSQNLHIDLKAGYQTLNGNQVEGVVRFRHNNDGSSYSHSYGNEDYGRMRTQRDLIIAVAKQTIQLKNVTEIKNIIDILSEYVDTNINLNNVKDYIPYAINMNTDNIQTAQVAGESKLLNGIWFFLIDEEETEAIVEKLFVSNEVTEVQQ